MNENDRQRMAALRFSQFAVPLLFTGGGGGGGGGGSSGADDTPAFVDYFAESPPPPAYDPRLGLPSGGTEDPISRLRQRLQESVQLLSLQVAPQSALLLQRVLFGAAVTNLEAFLWETADRCLEADDRALVRVVTQVPELRDRKLILGQLFDRRAGLRMEVKAYLQSIVWHRFPAVVTLFTNGLGVAEMPDLGVFSAAVEKRHHIVHRSGHDTGGAPISVSAADIETLHQQILDFAVALNRKLAERAPAGPAAGEAPGGPEPA